MNDTLPPYNMQVERYIARLYQRLLWLETNPFAMDLNACAETNS